LQGAGARLRFGLVIADSGEERLRICRIAARLATVRALHSKLTQLTRRPLLPTALQRPEILSFRLDRYRFADHEKKKFGCQN
jgi:hypothetical protein